MKMYVACGWTDSAEMTEVRSPYSGEVVDTVPSATPQDVEGALNCAAKGAVCVAKNGGTAYVERATRQTIPPPSAIALGVALRYRETVGPLLR
jgi:acyl-CoA reductase-like NAD-dependent aldehyde dehydrogenase